MLDYFHNYVMPLFHFGLDMGESGILIDPKVIGKFRLMLEKGVALKYARFEELTKREVLKPSKSKRNPGLLSVIEGVNPNSPLQVRKWLYEELKYPAMIDRNTKKLSTNEETIEKLCKQFGKDNPALRLLTWAKKSRKMLGLAKVVLVNGRLHTFFYVTGTESGRFSSKMTDDGEGTNLQNLPPWFRPCLMADPGFVLLEGDLSQAEARIVAYIAGEREMIYVFEDPKQSIHKLNAAKIFDLPIDKIVKDSRPTQPYGMAKRCTHGWDYMLGDRHAAEITGLTQREMAKHRTSYFRAYPNLLRWHKFIEDTALASKRLVTPFGRVRVFLGRPPKRNDEGELFPDNNLVRKMVAWVPQSTCTEYLKRGLLRSKPSLTPGAKFLLDTHDGFLLQCRPEYLKEQAMCIKKNMCVPLPIRDIFGKERKLTIPIELKTGTHWDHRMKEITV